MEEKTAEKSKETSGSTTNRMTKKYILTGGPGSGKSSILLELERRGEYIIREAAEDTIKLEQAKGNEKPWEDADFQRKILRLQIQREESIPKEVGRAFIDRGIADGLAYTKKETELYREIEKEIRTYAGVFLIKNLGSTETNRVRREDQTAALEIERKLGQLYQTLEYRVQRIAPAPVEERAQKILNIIKRNAPFRRSWR